MATVNKAILVGHVGHDPELRTTKSGTAVTTFSVATNEYWTDKEGGRRESTEWHRVVAWSKLAQYCAERLAKGRLVCVEGRIQSRSWEDKEGQTRYVTEIVAQRLRTLGPAPNGNGNGAHPALAEDAGEGSPMEEETADAF